MNDDHHVDTLIGDVAREMTAAPASDGFARRVSARIAERRRPRRSWTWIMVPAAAACVLAVAVYVGEETRMVVVPPAAERASAVRLKADATAPSIRLKPDTTYVSPARTAASLPAQKPIELSALDVPQPIEIDQIQIGAIAIDRIEIPPMP